MAGCRERRKEAGGLRDSPRRCHRYRHEMREIGTEGTFMEIKGRNQGGG